MKKLIAVLLSIVMLFGLSACGYGASVTADMEEAGKLPQRRTRRMRRLSQKTE